MNGNTGGWEDYTPAGPSGKFEKYKTQLVVIVITGFAKVKGRKVETGKIYLTPAVLNKLGNPKYLKLRTRGRNPIIGLFPWHEQQGAYAVTMKNKAYNTTPMISCSGFIKKYSVRRGVYTLVEENGVLLFDAKQAPSSI